MTNIIITVFLTLLFPFKETGEKYFSNAVIKYNLVYLKPSGYKFAKSPPNRIEIGDSLIFSNVSFIKSKDADITIGFYFQELKDSGKEQTSGPSNELIKKIVLLDVYRYNMKLGKEKPNIHPSNITSQYNANISGDYNIKTIKPLAGRYNNAKLVYFEKFDQLLVFVFYLYNHKDEDTANKLMENTYDILKFSKK